MDEFDGVGNTKVEKPEGYDLWADLSSLKANIIYDQLSEISPMARKTPTKGMSVIKTTRKVKTKGAAKIQLQGEKRDVKAIEVDDIVVDRMVPNVLVDGGSRLNILPEHIMKRLGLSFTGPSSFIINMANQTTAVPLGMIKNCGISIRG